MSIHLHDHEIFGVRPISYPNRSTIRLSDRIDGFARRLEKIELRDTMIDVQASGEYAGNIEFALRDAKGRAVRPTADSGLGMSKAYVLPSKGTYWLEITNLGATPDWFNAAIQVG